MQYELDFLRNYKVVNSIQFRAKDYVSAIQIAYSLARSTSMQADKRKLCRIEMTCMGKAIGTSVGPLISIGSAISDNSKKEDEEKKENDTLAEMLLHLIPLCWFIYRSYCGSPKTHESFNNRFKLEICNSSLT